MRNDFGKVPSLLPFLFLPVPGHTRAASSCSSSRKSLSHSDGMGGRKGEVRPSTYSSPPSFYFDYGSPGDLSDITLSAGPRHPSSLFLLFFLPSLSCSEDTRMQHCAGRRRANRAHMSRERCFLRLRKMTSPRGGREGEKCCAGIDVAAAAALEEVVVVVLSCVCVCTVPRAIIAPDFSERRREGGSVYDRDQPSVCAFREARMLHPSC